MGKTAKILVVDDKPSMLGLFTSMLEDTYELATAGNADQALRRVAEDDFDVVVTDIRMPHKDGLAILQEVKARKPQVEVIVMTAYGDIAQAVGAMKTGAYDYITKPFDPDQMQLVIHKAVEHKRLLEQTHRLQRQVEQQYTCENIVGTSQAMQKVYALVRDVRNSDATVLITGESGTGKELVARAVHYGSPRAHRPFTAINCAAIPRDLLETELFGHVKGAFSGAVAARRGLVEESDGGTLFLDEISELAPDLQGKITRMIQEREIRPIGATQARQVDLRIIAATNINLEEAVKDKSFREDLYYRIHVYPIPIPPLRERKEDIPLLADHFLRMYATRDGKPIAAIAPDALALLTRAAWPGNVRELEHVIERAVVLARGRTLTAETLPDSLRDAKAPGGVAIDITVPHKELLQTHADQISRAYVDKLLRAFDGNVTRAAQQAGMERETLHRLAKRLGINPHDYRGDSHN